jgi:DNA-binding NarL/FixJ family response regulator
VLVVVHQPELVSVLTTALREADGARCCGVASTLAEGVDQLRSTKVDVVVVGHDLPGVTLVEAVTAFRANAVGVPVVVLTRRAASGQLRDAMRAEAAGFATMAAEPGTIVELTQAVRPGLLLVEGAAALELATAGVHRGRRSSLHDEPTLTPREEEVLALLGRGLDPSTIADQLGVSVHTARGHVKKILGKLHAHSQLEAVVTAAELGLLPSLRNR